MPKFRRSERRLGSGAEPPSFASTMLVTKEEGRASEATRDTASLKRQRLLGSKHRSAAAWVS
jgi:hypothetical protein